MQDKIAIHCVVKGVVQGVWFRASTKDQAELLNVKGWVRNLPDGSVEVLACGERAQIATLHQWLQHGPARAKVDTVSYEELAWQEHEQFKVI